MNNIFPRMLYKAGGSEDIHGGRFSTLIVSSIEEQDAALDDGWSLTTTEAKEFVSAKQEQAAKTETKTYTDGTTATGPAPLPGQSPEQQAADDAPPTRAELEQKAQELGITFAANIGDKKLAEKIAEKLKG